MNKLVSELLKFDVAMPPADIDSQQDDDSGFFLLDHYRQGCFVVQAAFAEGATDTLLEGEEVTIALNQATDVAGTGEKAVEVGGVDVEVVLAGGVNATVAAIDITANRDDADRVTVNGIEFHRAAAGYDAADRPLAFNSRADLVSAINGQFDGIVASAGTGANVVHVGAAVPGEATVTIVDGVDDGGSYAGTLVFQAFIDVNASQLDTANGFAAVGVNVENDSAAGDGTFAVNLLRANYRYNPTQAVAG